MLRALLAGDAWSTVPLSVLRPFLSCAYTHVPIPRARVRTHTGFTHTHTHTHTYLTRARTHTHTHTHTYKYTQLDAKRAIDQSTRLAVMIEEATGKVKYEPATTMTSKLMGMMKR